MTIEIKAPTFPESVQEGSVATWHKKQGETVARDELIVDIETDKVVLEVVAPADGVLASIVKNEGDVILRKEVIALIEEGAAVQGAAPVQAPQEEDADDAGDDPTASPSARKLALEKGVDLAAIKGSGKGGRITREDVDNFSPSQPTQAPQAAPATAAAKEAPALDLDRHGAGDRIEKRVPMTRMRARIAERLLQVTQHTAMLTTFNEVDMHRIMGLRSEFKDQFADVHGGTRL